MLTDLMRAMARMFGGKGRRYWIDVQLREKVEMIVYFNKILCYLRNRLVQLEVVTTSKVRFCV